MTPREFATEVVRRLREAGFEALWAGGCVRDLLLGCDPYDFDVATSARPEQVGQLFRRTVAVGESFGVVRVISPRVGESHRVVEVATFRSDGTYTDGRRPDSVTYGSAQEDARRRDFTINGMFYDPLENHVIDFVGGQADLHDRILRAIGEPAARFTEDKLRLLRAVRFAARFDLNIDPATFAAIRIMAGQLTIVSAERIADELRKTLVDRHRGRAVRLLDETGLFAAVLPELIAFKVTPQGLPSAPTGNLWDHTVAVVEQLPEKVTFPLAFATILHDIGKPRTLARAPDRYTFHGHEHVGRRMAAEICRRLRLSNDERERIEWLVEKHQYLSDAPVMRPSRLKPVLAHPGIDELLVLHEADAVASRRGTDHVEFARRRLQEWTANGQLDPPPLLTGDDLKANGLKPGPMFKRLLDSIREGQLDGTIGNRDQALARAREILSREG
jgi:poly(A) polymerase